MLPSDLVEELRALGNRIRQRTGDDDPTAKEAARVIRRAIRPRRRGGRPRQERITRAFQEYRRVGWKFVESVYVAGISGYAKLARKARSEPRNFMARAAKSHAEMRLKDALRQRRRRQTDKDQSSSDKC